MSKYIYTDLRAKYGVKGSDSLSDYIDRCKKDIDSLNARLKKAESLLLEIKTTGSHYQIIDKVNTYRNNWNTWS